MKALLLFSALFLIPQQSDAKKREAGGKIPFQKDFGAALKEAQKQSKPVLLYVWAEWSAYCRELDTGAFSDDDVVKAAGAFVPVILNTADDHKKIFEQYHVRFTPTLLYLDSEGNLLDAHKDTWERDRILASLRLAARRFGGAFWCDSVAKALEAGKNEKRLVLVHVPAKDREPNPKEVEKHLRSALGDFAWKFCFACAEPADEPGTIVLNPQIEKPEEKPLAKLPADTPAAELKKKLEEVFRAWKKS